MAINTGPTMPRLAPSVEEVPIQYNGGGRVMMHRSVAEIAIERGEAKLDPEQPQWREAMAVASGKTRSKQS